MFDLVSNFIKNDFLNTSAELYGLDTILTHLSIILLFVFLVKVFIWFCSKFSF